MILVYAPKITSRLRYTLDLIFDNLLGQQWEVSSDKDSYLAFDGCRINYSSQPIGRSEFRIIPSGFLEKRGVQPFVPQIKKIHDLPCLFPDAEKNCKLGFDVFSAVFYLVSRYEEYLPHQADNHGRFKAEDSLAFKHGFLEIPLVDHYALLLQKELACKFNKTIASNREFKFYATYDIDVAYAYHGRGILRGTGATLQSLLKLQPGKIIERAVVLTGKKKDPFDTYDYQLALHKKHNLKAFYFFLCGDYSPFDKNISVFSGAFHTLVKKIGDYSFTGIHPSYYTSNNSKRLSTEVARLSKIMNREIRFSRQHYLKMHLPQTYRNLINININNDFSMGYAARPGFRASIANPFVFYDVPREEITNLKVFPFMIMDGTLRDYLGLNPLEAMQKIEKIINAVQLVNGTFISLWHNDSLCECNGWQGWRQVYEHLVLLATANRCTI